MPLDDLLRAPRRRLENDRSLLEKDGGWIEVLVSHGRTRERIRGRIVRRTAGRILLAVYGCLTRTVELHDDRIHEVIEFSPDDGRVAQRIAEIQASRWGRRP